MKATKVNPAGLRAIMDAGEPAVVKAFAPWCGFCTKFEAEFARVDMGGAAHVVRIDADKHKAALPPAVAEEVSGFPTVLFVKGDHVAPYTGPRVAAEVEKAAAAHFADLRGGGGDKASGAEKPEEPPWEEPPWTDEELDSLFQVGLLRMLVRANASEAVIDAQMEAVAAALKNSKTRFSQRAGRDKRDHRGRSFEEVQAAMEADAAELKAQWLLKQQ